MTIDPVFHGALKLGVLEMAGVRVMESSPQLKQLLTSLADEYAQKYKGVSPGEIPEVRQIRSIFHRAGVDPTRHRPSSEALLRRAVTGKGLYFINSVVDLVNYFSLRLLYPIGLYDADHLRPPLALRVGRDGETYEGIGRDRLNLNGFPLLVDQEGPFGSPISDSVRTRVTESTARILWITFAPPGASIPMKEFANSLEIHNGGTVSSMEEI